MQQNSVEEGIYSHPLVEGYQLPYLPFNKILWRLTSKKVDLIWYKIWNESDKTCFLNNDQLIVIRYTEFNKCLFHFRRFNLVFFNWLTLILGIQSYELLGWFRIILKCKLKTKVTWIRSKNSFDECISSCTAFIILKAFAFYNSIFNDITEWSFLVNICFTFRLNQAS